MVLYGWNIFFIEPISKVHHPLPPGIYISLFCAYPKSQHSDKTKLFPDNNYVPAE
jgi:hypothetical protein